MEIQWALVLFTVISGAGAWLFAFSMLGYLLKKDATPSKMETIVAFVLVAVGGCMSVLHLSHVDRILEALNHPTSGIFVEAAMIGVLCVILAVYFVLLVRGSSEKARTAVGVLGLLVGMVFTYACGSSYMMEARPAWQTVALPLAYFAFAMLRGRSGKPIGHTHLVYPYPFLDLPRLGWRKFTGYVTGMLLSFFLLGYGMMWLGRLVGAPLA